MGVLKSRGALLPVKGAKKRPKGKEAHRKHPIKKFTESLH